jgi:hypothetical protein
VRALPLAPLEVLGLDERDTGASPLLGERVCVIHMHVDRSTAHALSIHASSREMNRQLVPVCERISLVMMRSAEAQLLVVGNRARYIRDHEDRLNAYDALHAEIIGIVVCRSRVGALASRNIPQRWPPPSPLMAWDPGCIAAMQDDRIAIGVAERREVAYA